MNKAKKHLLFWIPFAVIFIGLLVIASIYDLQISQLLASKDLVDGNYVSVNIFGRIFKVIGELPLYIFLLFAAEVIFTESFKVNKKPLRIFLQVLFTVGGIVAGFVGYYKIGKYLSQINPTAYGFLYEEVYMFIIYVILASILQVVLQYILSKKYRELCSKLLPFAIIILITAALSQAIVHGIKPIAARERFRAIYWFDYRGIETQGFTPWYIINGNAKEIADSLGVKKTYFTSFPSGHTAAAGICYSLMFLPSFFEKLNNKKYRWLFAFVPTLITGIVALSRIVVGAHYMSDVLFGGTFAFISAIIAYLIVNKIFKKKA